jgi:hypothetical protein
MLHLLRRLQKPERHRREKIVFAPTPGDARRILEERLERMHRCIQAERDRGEFVEPPNLTVEQVTEMIHARLEENRIQREENEKRIAERRWASGYSGSSLWT